jgi:UDP-N-acetylglucosamine 2-epimerase (non-hydrolysing)
MRSVLRAVRDVLDAHPDTIATLPAHPNPAVRADVMSVLGADHRVVITEPLNYPDLVGLLKRSSLVLSDSGGIQEEAPSFGVPVLVLRERTERLEAVEAGCAFLVGTDRDVITAAASRLLTVDPARRESLSVANPFGDGHAAQRAAIALARLLAIRVDRVPQFVSPPPRNSADPILPAEPDLVVT